MLSDLSDRIGYQALCLTSANEGLTCFYVSNVLGLFSRVSLLLKKEAALISIQQALDTHLL